MLLDYWLEFGFGIFAAALTLGYKMIAQKMKNSQQEQNSIKKGIQALLRDRILQLHGNQQQKGYCTVAELDNALAMYKEYTALGGNGTVKELIGDLKKMPRQPKEA